jgi:MYXO-CTERM domain-containing protein
VNLDEPEGLEMVLSLPGEATTYRPCFAFRAFDARGDIVAVEPLCLTEEVPVATTAEPEPNTGPASNPASDSGRNRSSSACTFQASPARGSTWWAGTLVAVTALSRRRRSRNVCLRSW